MVTHDLGLAWNIADRLAVMYLGRVVEIGTTEDGPGRRRSHPYTKALLSVVPEVQRLEPIVLQGETPDPTRIPDGCRFNPRCPALASGEAEAAGIAQACTTRPLDKLLRPSACTRPRASFPQRRRHGILSSQTDR